jgi:hypothetical protein
MQRQLGDDPMNHRNKGRSGLPAPSERFHGRQGFRAKGAMKAKAAMRAKRFGASC